MVELASAVTMVTAALAERNRPAVPHVLLIDGRSGTGKTTLANALGPLLGAQVVHLDDVYPGWDGLRAASDTVVTGILGADSGYWGWDWARNRRTAWRSVRRDKPVVVEGCGALSRASSPLASLRIWLDAPDAVRKKRALDRDGAVFARQWDRWAAQEEAFIAREQPRDRADLVLELAG